LRLTEARRWAREAMAVAAEGSKVSGRFRVEGVAMAEGVPPPPIRLLGVEASVVVGVHGP